MGVVTVGVRQEGRQAQSGRMLGFSKGMFGFVISPLKFVITNGTTFLIFSFVWIQLADSLPQQPGLLINHLDNQMSLAICSM